jgi:hypothetical protein
MYRVNFYGKARLNRFRFSIKGLAFLTAIVAAYCAGLVSNRAALLTKNAELAKSEQERARLRQSLKKVELHLQVLELKENVDRSLLRWDEDKKPLEWLPQNEEASDVLEKYFQ